MEAPSPLNGVVGLGASLGDRAGSLHLAVRLLAVWPGLRVRQCSRVFATPPVGGIAGAPFLNAAVRVESTLDPESWAQALRTIETRIGRRPTRRWADRVIDLDLLWIEGKTVHLQGLDVPHPRLLERDFAVIPLVEVAPEARDPLTGVRYADLAVARARLVAVGTLPALRLARPPFTS